VGLIALLELYEFSTICPNYTPLVEKIESEVGATATRYTLPGFKGKVGIIPAFSRTFCGT
jgi:cyclic pyranopterin phosphate synthase